MLVHVYRIADQNTSLFIFPFAASNLIDAPILEKLFDTIGRRKMITFTCRVSGIPLAINAQLFFANLLTATTHTVILCVIFFLTSAGASSAYLTISEIFPLELRAQAISFFFAISQLLGGVAAPLIFSHLIGDGTNPEALTVGYYTGAAIMTAGGIIAWRFGVDAERKSLEDIANPLSAAPRPIEPAVEPSRPAGASTR